MLGSGVFPPRDVEETPTISKGAVGYSIAMNLTAELDGILFGSV